MYRQLSALMAVLLLPTIAWAQVWHLQGCPPEHAESREALRQHLTELKPGERGYRPHPFPTTRQEVVEDFLHFHRRAFSDTDFDDLPAADQRLFSVVDSGRAEYRLRRVANWTPSRCGQQERQDYFFVVQVFDSETGIEVARFAVDEEGDVVQVRHRLMEPGAENDLAPMESLQVTSGRFAAALPAPPRALQYVNLWGSVRCSLMDPCVAFKAGPEAYFMQDDVLYGIESNRPLMKVGEEMGSPRAKRDFLDRLVRRGEMFVSIGGGDLAYVSRVEP